VESPNRRTVRDWLESIGSPPEEIEEVLQRCTQDPETRAYFVKQAQEALGRIDA
jgi:hypothetical protein